MNNTTGEKIKRLRKEKKITVQQLANIVGIKHPSMSNIENGKRNPTLNNLNKIASALGVTTAELIGTNKIEVKIDSTFEEAFSNFVTNKRYLLDVKEYDSIEAYNEELEKLYLATIEYIEFYCYKLKNS